MTGSRHDLQRIVEICDNVRYVLNPYRYLDTMSQRTYAGPRRADDVPELLWATGMTRADIRRAMQIVKEQQAFLLERWSEIHG